MDWLLSTAITFGMFAFHFAIRFLIPGLVIFLHRGTYAYNNFWFRPKRWEPRIYQFLKVKTWKSKVLSYHPEQFSFKCHTAEEIINYMCQAEIVHECIVIGSFTSLFFAIPFGALPVFLITAIFAAGIDLLFVIIQRYNRPRIVKMIKKTA